MRTDLDRSRLSVEFHFDFVCPWCWIGRRHLAEAVRRFGQVRSDLATETIWHGLQLLPETPAAGLPYQAFYERRLGSQAAVVARRQQVAAAGRTAGLEFRFDRIRTMPNTALAHALTRHVLSAGGSRLADTMIEHLFASYFLDGIDIGNAEALCQVGASLGLDPAELRRVLAAADLQSSPVPGDAPAAGVPHYFFDGGLSISGAQPPETLLALLHRSATHLTDLQGIAS